MLCDSMISLLNVCISTCTWNHWKVVATDVGPCTAVAVQVVPYQGHGYHDASGQQCDILSHSQIGAWEYGKLPMDYVKDYMVR